MKGLFFTQLSNGKSVFQTIDLGFAVSTLLRREKRVNKCSAVPASMDGDPSSLEELDGLQPIIQPCLTMISVTVEKPGGPWEL